MKLTKKEAIELTLKMWRDLAETGKGKGAWFKRYPEYKGIYLGCFLCEFGTRKRPAGSSCCIHCPYSEKFYACMTWDSPYFKWTDAPTPKTRKEYAALFVKQLSRAIYQCIVSRSGDFKAN